MRELGPGCYAELPIHLPQVVLDGRRAEEQLGGNVAVAASLAASLLAPRRGGARQIQVPPPIRGPAVARRRSQTRAARRRPRRPAASERPARPGTCPRPLRRRVPAPATARLAGGRQQVQVV